MNRSERFKQMLFVSTDTTFCRLPHPNACGGKTLPERLLKMGFSDLGWDEHKRIYLPASQKFPQPSYILEEQASPRVKHKRLALAGQRRVRDHQVRDFDWTIDESIREYILEQGRAQTDLKILPWMNIWSGTYQGTASMPFTIVCDSVTTGPSKNCPWVNLQGSFVTIEPWLCRTAKRDETIRQCYEQITGFGKGCDIKPVRRPFWQMLEQKHPQFPWIWGGTRSWVD